MKAKIIKTGEIVEVYHEPQHGQVSNIYKESVLVNGRMWQENELEFIESKEADLEKEVDIEDAVHGTVDYPLIGCDFPNIYPDYKELKEYCDRKDIKDNDKVKLILIKDM